MTEKKREKRELGKLFHTRMQSKIKIPNKPPKKFKKKSKPTEITPKLLTPNTWRVKGDGRRGRERSR